MTSTGSGVTLGPTTASRVAADVQQLAGRLDALPWADGILLTDVALNAAANTVIAHGLRRTPRGWWVVDFAGAGASDYPRRIASNTNTLTLYVTNAATVALWVF